MIEQLLYMGGGRALDVSKYLIIEASGPLYIFPLVGHDYSIDGINFTRITKSDLPNPGQGNKFYFRPSNENVLNQLRFYVNQSNRVNFKGVVQWWDYDCRIQFEINNTSNNFYVPSEAPLSITDWSHMFNGASGFNQDISNYNTSHVTKMDWFLYGTSSFNQNLSSWCVEKILTKPLLFDSNGHGSFVNNASKQPKWGSPCT